LRHAQSSYLLKSTEANRLNDIIVVSLDIRT
jgi:hypothetical protein